MSAISHFERSEQYHFWVRPGPGYREGDLPPCQKKLCLTSTDIERMAEVLYTLSLRDDCWYVKLDQKLGPHGMVRGRCFMTTPEAVGELWLKYKVTDSLLCTVQDDEFTARFRSS